MLPDDTIAAISTPVGEGGIGIVRLSGSRAIEISAALFHSPRARQLRDARSHSLILGNIVDPATGEAVDEVLVAVMRSPATYTREDVVEINCHSGIVPLRRILGLALSAGARLAEPGEFTRRAYLSGRIDLSQAEAVIDVIRARTDLAERIAQRQLEGRLSEVMHTLREEVTEACVRIEAQIDFPEEDIEAPERDELLRMIRQTGGKIQSLSREYEEGRFFRDGVATAIVGKPNVGKSSLLNVLLQCDRAIVTEMPGTTRDIVEDTLNINGLPLRVMDTAGIREALDLAEREGVRRSLKAIEEADIVLALFDASRPVDEADQEVLCRVRGRKTIFVLNKCDIQSPLFRTEALWPEPEERPESITISAKTGDGIDVLKDEICRRVLPHAGHILGGAACPDAAGELLITNMRHKQSLDRALETLTEAEEAFGNGAPYEVVALFLRESLDHLGEIIGVVTTDDILKRIFDRFCIGK